MMRGVVGRAVGSALLVGFLLSGCAQPQAQSPEPTEAVVSNVPQPTAAPDPAPTVVPGGRVVNGTVVANARVVPISDVAILVAENTLVSDVFVEDGDVVAAGDPLIQLDSRGLQLRVEEAEADLAGARANYERLLEGATEEAIAQAEADIQAAQARVRQIEGSVTSADIDAARAYLNEARSELAALQAGPTDLQVEILQAELDQALARERSVADRLATDKAVAESRMHRVANDLRNAQQYYEQLYWFHRNRSGDELTPQEEAAEAAALRDVEDWQRLLNEAELDFEQSRKAEIAGLEGVAAEVREARSRLEQLFEPATPEDVAAAQRRVFDAQATLEGLTGLEAAGRVDVARAQLAEAEATLAALQNSASPSDLAVAQASVQRAEVRLAQAQLALDQLLLRAPISGMVMELDILSGSYADKDAPVMLIADTSAWRIQIDSLNELSVVHVREGDPATISFFALPGYELTGRVVKVDGVGRDAPGETGNTYEVIIEPDTWDDRLRWNMTATVEIRPES
jgi:HlyD family secretion protein